MKPTQVVFIGLDALDTHIARDLMADGRMPNLARLVATGATAPTMAPPGLFVSTVWPSTMTGLMPDRHRYTCSLVHDPRTSTFRPFEIHDGDGTPLWDVVADVGPVAAFDVPHFPVSSHDGVESIAEWGCHDRHMGTASSPVTLLDDLHESVGPHPVGLIDPGPGKFAPCDAISRDGAIRTGDEDVEVLGALVEGVERKERAIRWFLRRRDWRMFLAVFGESHCVGHQLWHRHDPSHPWHDPEWVERHGDAMAQVYERIDAALGRIADDLDDGVALYVLLSHGMGPEYSANHLLDPVLTRLDRVHRGLLEPSPGARPLARALDYFDGAGPLLAAAAPLLRRRPRNPDPLPVDLVPDHPDKSERLFWTLHNYTTTGAVRLNVKGREATGRIDPYEVDAVIDRLARELRELVNVETGEPAVRDVWRTDHHYRRTPDDHLPDLIVEWRRTSVMERLWSPRIGTVDMAFTYNRSGDHHAIGMLVANGPGIDHRTLPPIRSVDVAPTLAVAAGTGLADVDGRAIAGLLPERLRHLGHHTVADTSAPTSLHECYGAPVDSIPRALARAARSAVRRAGHRLTGRRRTLQLARAQRTTGSLVAGLQHTDRAIERELEGLATAHHATREKADERLVGLEDRVATLERVALIEHVTRWIAGAEVPEKQLVSIVIPSFNRADTLGRAIDSALAQTYRHIEVLVVDDGSTDNTSETLAAYDDPRLHCIHLDENGGMAAARNVALERAEGELIAYLDSDNTLDPTWVRSVVWAFNQHPDRQWLYGARLFDDGSVGDPAAPAGIPAAQLLAFDPDTLRTRCLMDQGTIAHRAHDAIRFDESLLRFADWDLALQLTELGPPLELPAVAVHYTTNRADRSMLVNDEAGEFAKIMAKWAERSGPR